MTKTYLLGCAFSLIASTAFADVSEGLSLLEAGDVAGAAEAFATAYDADDAEGAFYLGRLFELGLGTDQDETRAANLYSAAAEKGSAQAQVRLGLIYHEGRILLRDYVEGTRLICAAAEADHAEGQLNCGLAYQTGLGVDQDAERAASYLEQASAQGNIAALNVLGQLHTTEGDSAKGAEYFLQAAELGNALGMFEYASYLASQDEGDLTEAYAYASLAMVRGLTDAGALLDGLEAQMDASDVLAGQARAREWTNTRIAQAEE
ncbi:tetratricopeptide repeat protein [Thalassobius sp. I31.1]|uniref:tetratricopeptide repeat protein n=1 Tax=Thalassobius sp. I31.1 TaxID=2109912 RepID=UPI000D1B5A63|nr:tetratricopeptide repeat protein [Thalassobius sp. I31.1]